MEGEEMQKKLQKVLKRLIEGQDETTVNETFDEVFCNSGQFCKVDLERGKCEIRSEESDSLIQTIRFKISISEE
jgi:hypothetical protein